MNKLIFKSTLIIFTCGFLGPAIAQEKGLDTIFNAKKVQDVMVQVADWQINDWNSRGFKKPKYNWTYGAAYTGIFEYGRLSRDKKYLDFLLAIGRDLKWNTGARRFFADDYCVAQTFCNLYMIYRDAEMIAPFKALADSIIFRPHTESLSLKNPGVMDREWAWCDALFMAPTSLAYLTSATGEMKYLNMANRLWWKTTDFLYDKDEHLYFRDDRFFDKRELNGKKIFWSRGNGWVMGGLVRMLENMPKNYPDRPRYIRLYRQMAEKLRSLQQADGSWHASLLDPDSYPVKETSGTGFYTYAILWGLNNRILDQKIYWPVVEKSWKALVGSIHADGMLGYVQPVGASPDQLGADSTETYGPGALLLAGSEMLTFLKKINSNIN